jgi:hypothetical protein
MNVYDLFLAQGTQEDLKSGKQKIELEEQQPHQDQ